MRSLASRLVFLFALVLGAGVEPAPAEESWTRVRSAHFEVLSNGAPERARLVAVGLERFRRVLAEVLGRAPERDDPPTVVVAFRGQDSFAPFRPLYRGRPQDVEGYFQAGSDRDYIAASLGSDGQEASETLFHEYAHVVLNRTQSAQPLWLSEGLAEVFSRWTATDAEALVGLPAPDHLRRLQREKPLPLARLLQVDGSSPLYNEGDERGIFYSQSWALAHWIVFGRGPNARADLQAFLSAITAGVEPARAFASAFGASPDAAEGPLAAYVAAPLPVGRFHTSGLDGDVSVESEVPRRAEVEFRLGDLLLHAGRLPEARRHLERAVESDPRFGPAHAALAHAAVRQGRWEEARREVALALAADPADAVALSRYAELLVRETSARGEVLSAEREAEAVAALERALTLDPQLADACELLARLRPQPYDVRIAQVLVALGRDPARADLGLTLAALYATEERLHGGEGRAPAHGGDGARRRRPVPQPAPALATREVDGGHGRGQRDAPRPRLPARRRAALRGRGRGSATAPGGALRHRRVPVRPWWGPARADVHVRPATRSGDGALSAGPGPVALARGRGRDLDVADFRIALTAAGTAFAPDPPTPGAGPALARSLGNL